MRRLLLALFAIAVTAFPAFAFDTPDALLKALYTPYSQGTDFDWSKWDEAQFRSKHLNDLFAKDLKEAAEELKVPFLGEVPLDIPTREGSDEGEPIVTAQPESAQAVIFREIAGNLARQVSIQSRQFRPLPVM